MTGGVLPVTERARHAETGTEARRRAALSRLGEARDTAGVTWHLAPYLYATRNGVLNPGQGCTVFGRTAAGLADEVAKAEALGKALAAKRAGAAGRG
jgi:hypothetical protein